LNIKIKASGYIGEMDAIPKDKAEKIIIMPISEANNSSAIII
jgi:hypothetical protein